MKNLNLKKTALAAGVLTSLMLSSIALSAPHCASVPLDGLSYAQIHLADLAQQAAENYDSPNIRAYNKLQALKNRNQALANDAVLNTGFRKVLEDETLSTFHDLLSTIVDKVASKFDSGALTAQSNRDAILGAFKQATKEELTQFMPESMAETRANLLGSGELNKAIMLQALGRMTAQESLRALIGSGGIRNIDPQSLVGRYIREAAAAGVNVSSTIGRFPRGPGGSFGTGPDKFYISVDARTSAIADRIFGRNPHLLTHDHSSGQGTLAMHHLGKNYTYASTSEKVLGSGWGGGISENTIVPVMVLSSLEGSYTKNYFDLFSSNRPNAKYPWGLKRVGQNNEVEESYCRTGGYGSCTHWVGEMGIGEEYVERYALPGNIGDDPYGHGANLGDSGQDPRALRTSRVGSRYTHFVSNSGRNTEIGTTTRNDRLTRMVWTENRGRKQLWEMVGDHGAGALGRGEWTNPGWVLNSFLTIASEERIPMALIYRSDASQPLTQQTLVNLATNNVSPR